MTMCELATIVGERLPVKFAIINNNVLGMVHQWQEFFYDKSYVATAYTANPDFVKLAEAFGIKGMRVTDKVQVRGAIEEAMAHDGPVIIDFIVEEEERVYPMIKAGGTIEDLVEEPVFTPQEVADDHERYRAAPYHYGPCSRQARRPQPSVEHVPPARL